MDFTCLFTQFLFLTIIETDHCIFTPLWIVVSELVFSDLVLFLFVFHFPVNLLQYLEHFNIRQFKVLYMITEM